MSKRNVVEGRTSGRTLLDEKVAIYLANGCRLVFVVDPVTRSAEMHEASTVTSFVEPAVATCAIYPDLRIELTELFARL